MIKLNQASVVVTGGVDTLSDPPIKVSENLRSAIVKTSRVKKQTINNPTIRLKILMTITTYFLDSK